MKDLLKYILLFLLVSKGLVFAQDVTTVTATDSDISDNLDLEAVVSLFGECENLEDFEKRLNDPETQISNLDLNEDGEVDYLRVVENSKDGTFLITIQAVLGDDLFQDVATIDVEKDESGETQVQVVGDVYMYGPDYIIEPVYVSPPVMYVYFWGPHYHPWHSPYYWHYYPPYYRPRPPFPPHIYRSNVSVHVSVHNSYRHTTVRRSSTSVHIHSTTRRNDYARSNPNKSFDKRNNGATNRQDLNRQRTNNTSGTARSSNSNNNRSSNTRDVKSTNTRQSTGKATQSDWKPASGNTNRSTQAKSTNTRNSNTNTKQSRPANSNNSSTKGTKPANSNRSNTKSTRSTNTKKSNSKSSSTRTKSSKSSNNNSGKQKSSRSGSSSRKSRKR